MPEKTKILCVDDEPTNLLIFETIFGKKYEVLTAESGKNGLAILESDPDIGIVFTDMHMPEMDGLELIKLARKRFSNKNYFMLSGFDITREIQAALDERIMQAYFQKPANFKQIETELNRIVQTESR